GNAVISCIAYMRQMLWPSGLAAFYPLAVRDIIASRVLMSLILLTVISIVVFLLRRRRYLVTGWLWYLVMLGPVVGILQVGSQAHADRYTYLPQIGLAILVTWALADLCSRWRHRAFILAPLAAGVLVFLGFSAQTQAAYWKNS